MNPTLPAATLLSLMAELIIDDDWKKQAQDEKRKLAEAAEKQAASSPPSPPTTGGSPFAGGRAPASAASGDARARAQSMPAASLETLVQSVVTQTLYYLGDIATRGGEPNVNLDLAKHHLDLLGVIEAKTRNNLDETEQHFLDTAAYEARSRFIAVASQMIV